MAEIIVSAAAKEYLQRMLAKQQGSHLRISIKKTGCSGYSYLPTVTVDVQSTDTKILVDDLDIYLDTAWLHLLDGVEIDYIEDDKTGLKQRKLVFNNPKEAGRCGCGESFHIE